MELADHDMSAASEQENEAELEQENEPLAELEPGLRLDVDEEDDFDQMVLLLAVPGFRETKGIFCSFLIQTS